MSDIDIADDQADVTAEDYDEGSPPRSRLTVVLISVLVGCVVAVTVAVGYLWGNRTAPTPAAPVTITAASVDAGFARDMSTHHTQAVTMAGYERDNTTNPALKTLAFDIETSQEEQIGQMQGWLDSWGLTRDSTIRQMHWMVGHSLEPDGLMPGMATPDQMTKLESSHGTALDILFLQLMIHHHQGGIVMAQYAAQHATEPYVRDLAESMYVAQTNEIVTMEQLLRQLGAAPLPPPN
jgi:uncharacterized protein (DUF305 family)